MLSILLLYFKKEVKKDFLAKYQLFKLEIKTYFTTLYDVKWYGFDFKAYFDRRIFHNFGTKWSCFVGLVKILLFIHVVSMLVDIIFAWIYFLEFLINVLFQFVFFCVGNFFSVLSNLTNFLAFEKRKYMDYEKMHKKIVTYLRIKRLYKKKGKIYTYISDNIDPNEKAIKSFLRKKKIDIKFNHISTFFLDLENTFKMDIRAYLNEQMGVRRKSYKRWGYYLYLLVISFFYYVSRLIVFMARKLANKQLYIDLYLSVSTYVKTTIPRKTKKVYLYYYYRWHKKIFIFGNVCFQHVYRFITFFYTRFIGKIRAFFLKFFIPFQYVRWLKKTVQRETISYAYNKHIVFKDLCAKYGLNYDEVIEHKNSTYKYFTASEYFFHKIGIRRNYYFVYLRSYLLDLYTRNPKYAPTYRGVLYLNFSRYYLYIFKNIWPHIYATTAMFLMYFLQISTFVSNWVIFLLVCIFSFPFLVLKSIKSFFNKVLNKVVFLFRVVLWFVKTRKKK